MLPDLAEFLPQLPLLYVALGLWLVYMISTAKSGLPDNIPPTPVKPYPIVGHIPYLRDPKEQLPKKMQKWRAKAGNMFSIYIGSQLHIVLSGYDEIKEALVKQADLFSDRPNNWAQDRLLKWEMGGYKGILQASGETWKEQRTVALSILRQFGMGKNSLAQKIEEEVQEYLQAVASLEGRPSDIRLLTNNCVSNVICNIILGRRFELDDEDFIKMLTILNEQVVIFAKTFPLNSFPILEYLPGDPFKSKQLMANFKEMDTFITGRFVKPMVENPDDINTDSFISAYVEEMKKRNESGKQTTMDYGNLCRVIFNLFAAGSETTSTTIVWFCLFMIHHPHILADIQKELDDVVGRERAPSVQDKPKLPLLNAAILETQRLGNIVPIALTRKCRQTTTIGGYTIPAGAVIMPNLECVQMSEHVWDDPKTFRPARFLDDEGNLGKIKDEFMPFSIGRRSCLGESLAKMELFLFMSGICQRFDIKAEDPDNLPPMDKSIFGITCAPQAYKAKFIDRNLM